jgi:hypothetical protein
MDGVSDTENVTAAKSPTASAVVGPSLSSGRAVASQRIYEDEEEAYFPYRREMMDIDTAVLKVPLPLPPSLLDLFFSSTSLLHIIIVVITHFFFFLLFVRTYPPLYS